MNRKMQMHRSCSLALASVVGMASIAKAQAVLDGSLDSGDGSFIVAQTNVTTSQNANGGGPSGPGNEANAGSTGNFTQLSNIYSSISGTGASATLNLFIGGSVTQDTDTKIDIALQTNGNGVSNLNGKTFAGAADSSNLQKITFDSGFKPNAFIVLDTNNDMSGGTGNGLYNLGGSAVAGQPTGAYGVTDLTGGMHTTTITGTLNNALVNTPIGTGAPGDPGFAGASTGLELSIPLASLGYTDGDSVEGLAFPSVGSDNRTDNQILAPFTYNPSDTSGGYDYTYFDNNEENGAVPNRQFTGEDYIGNQYFTVSATPEPTSLALLGLGAAPMIFGRRRKSQAVAE